MGFKVLGLPMSTHPVGGPLQELVMLKSYLNLTNH